MWTQIEARSREHRVLRQEVDHHETISMGRVTSMEEAVEIAPACVLFLSGASCLPLIDNRRPRTAPEHRPSNLLPGKLPLIGLMRVDEKKFETGPPVFGRATRPAPSTTRNREVAEPTATAASYSRRPARGARDSIDRLTRRGRRVRSTPHPCSEEFGALGV